jgi:hypothetical protein
MSKLELIKQLEYFIAFQANCLANGDWDSFDKVENDIKRLEEKILACKDENRIL